MDILLFDGGYTRFVGLRKRRHIGNGLIEGMWTYGNGVTREPGIPALSGGAGVRV
jgi:hypothetical protein